LSTGTEVSGNTESSGNRPLYVVPWYLGTGSHCILLQRSTHTWSDISFHIGSGMTSLTAITSEMAEREKSRTATTEVV
jgi:hypothetical protein